MDPVTQGLLGSICSQIACQRKIGKRAAIVGALAGMAPDLDILLRSSQAPLLSIYYHRHFTHSLTFIPIGGLLVGLWFILFFKSCRNDKAWVIAAAIIGYATHGLLDAFTSYGTLLYWPFSLERISWDTMPIINIYYTGILALGVTVALVFKNSRYALMGLVVASLYMAYMYYLHACALDALEDKLKQEHPKSISTARVMPLLFDQNQWYAIYRSEDYIYINRVQTDWLGNSKLFTYGRVKHLRPKELPHWIQHTPTLLEEAKLFSWFTQNNAAVISTNPYIAIDARYVLLQNPPIALWGITFEPNWHHIRRISKIKLLSQTKDEK